MHMESTAVNAHTSATRSLLPWTPKRQPHAVYCRERRNVSHTQSTTLNAETSAKWGLILKTSCSLHPPPPPPFSSDYLITWFSSIPRSVACFASRPKRCFHFVSGTLYLGFSLRALLNNGQSCVVADHKLSGGARGVVEGGGGYTMRRQIQGNCVGAIHPLQI